MHSKQKQVEEQSVLDKKKEREKAKAEVSDDLKFNSTMGIILFLYSVSMVTRLCMCTGKNIYRAIFSSRPPARNELFSSGRMVISINYA